MWAIDGVYKCDQSPQCDTTAQGFSEDQRGEIEAVIKQYLLAHPEIIQEVMVELEKRQAEAETAKHREGIKQWLYALAVKMDQRPASVGVLANQVRDFDSVR